MVAHSSSHETCSRIRLRLALIVLAVVGFTLAGMAGGLVAVLVVAFTVSLAMSLLGDSGEAGSVIAEDRNGQE